LRLNPKREANGSIQDSNEHRRYDNAPEQEGKALPPRDRSIGRWNHLPPRHDDPSQGLPL